MRATTGSAPHREAIPAVHVGQQADVLGHVRDAPPRPPGGCSVSGAIQDQQLDAVALHCLDHARTEMAGTGTAVMEQHPVAVSRSVATEHDSAPVGAPELTRLLNHRTHCSTTSQAESLRPGSHDAGGHANSMFRSIADQGLRHVAGARTDRRQPLRGGAQPDPETRRLADPPGAAPAVGLDPVERQRRRRSG